MHKPHGVGRWTGQGGRLDEHSKRQRNERGQAMVEFALTITLTLLLVFGMIDFSRAIYTASVIQWAAQQGARTAMVDPAGVRAAVVNRLAGLDPDEVDVNVTTGANTVQVEVSYEFDFIVPMISRITGDSIIFTASASMMVQ